MLNSLKPIDFLKTIPPFSELPDNILMKLSEQATEHNHGKGKLLFMADDPAEHFYLIKSGWVKLYRETLDGEVAVVDILTTGHIFGETALFEDLKYSFSAETVEDVGLIRIPLSDLKNEIEKNNDLTFSMLAFMTAQRRKKDHEIEHKTLQSAPQRIGCFLLKLTPNQAKGAVTIHLPYDKTLIAARLGMQPETFSRALNKLKKATDMSVKGAIIELQDIEKLISFSCRACTAEYPCKDRRI